MSTERMTVEAVEQAIVEFDAEDRAIVGRQVVMDLALTGMVVARLAPREWEEVAAHLVALADRAPIKEGRAYVAHRAIYGALAQDLRTYARIAGEPIGLEADLRGATSKAEEQRIRARIADQQAALDRHLDDISVQNGTDHASTIEDIERVDALMDAATRRALAQEYERMGRDNDQEQQQEEAPTTRDPEPAAPTTEQPDAPEYLL